MYFIYTNQIISISITYFNIKIKKKYKRKIVDPPECSIIFNLFTFCFYHFFLY